MTLQKKLIPNFWTDSLMELSLVVTTTLVPLIDKVHIMKSAILRWLLEKISEGRPDEAKIVLRKKILKGRQNS